MFEVALVLAAFALGVAVSQKVKDWLAGVPAEVRAEADKLIAAAKTKL